MQEARRVPEEQETLFLEFSNYDVGWMIWTNTYCDGYFILVGAEKLRITVTARSGEI